MLANRREFLQSSAAVGAATLLPSIATADTVAAAVNVPPKTLPKPEPLIHALGRMSFGVTEDMISTARAIGYSAWLGEQLNPDQLDTTTLEQAIAASLPTIAMSAAELVALQAPMQVVGELRLATSLRAAFSPAQLYEVMVEFWSNHFSVYHLDNQVRVLKSVEDREVIRTLALGKFRDLLQASAKSPAMLVYLDNFASSKDAPNENYARELLELHTVGINGGFTEDDVQEVARAFSGWSINRRLGTFRFFRNEHDEGEKLVLGQTIAAGGGVEDGEQVLDILASHRSTASFIARKLAVRFVSDNPDQDVVDDLTQVFIDTDGDIRQVLRRLFTHSTFINSADQKFKRPFEFTVALVRQTGANVSGIGFRALGQELQAMGQVPFDWIPPNGYPDVEAYWASTNGLLQRWNLALEAAAGNIQDVRINYANLLTAPYTPVNIVQQLASNVLHRPLSDEDAEIFIDFLAAGRSPNASINQTQVQAQLPQTLALMLSSPYFQRR